MQNNAPGGNPSSPIEPREPQIALLMSICPGLGQLYAGHLARGVIAYVALIIVSWLAAIAFMNVENRFVSILLLAVPFAGVVLIALDAYRCAKEQSRDYRLAWFNSTKAYVGIFLLLLVTANPLMDFFVGKNVVRAFYVTSDSMEPTLLGNDILVINKLASPKKGDIALIKLNRQEKQSAQLTSIMADQVVSRIIAGPGDTLEIRGKEVRVNGEKREESYAYYSSEVSTINMGEELNKFGPKQIPADTYFVLGDNRNYAVDSRVLGFIGKNRISGIATKVFWSWNLDQNTIQWDRTAMALK